MQTISQRELRNDNARIIRGVEAGESFIVTRRGVPVARVVPVDDRSELRPARPARRHVRYGDLPRVESDVTIAEVLDDLRGDR